MSENLNKNKFISLKTCILLSVALIWTSYVSMHLSREWGWGLGKSNPVSMWVSQIFSTVFVFFLLKFFLCLPRAWINRKKDIVVFFVYLAIFLLIALSVAPGCFTEDTYYSFLMVKNGHWSGWYSWVHPALMTAMIQVIPWGFYAPGLFLAMLWAIVFGGAHLLLHEIKARMIWHFVAPFLVFLPSQLLATSVIVRDSFFAAFFLLLLGYIFFLLVVKKSIESRDLIAVSSSGALLMFYRLDAMPAVLILSLFLLYFYCGRNFSSILKFKNHKFVLVPFLALFIFSALVPHVLESWDNRAKNEYKITLIENPLGYIVRNGGELSASEVASIEQVFKIDDLQKHYCAANLCVFYGGFWNKESTRKQRSDAFKAALNVFAKNPRLFLESRWATLASVGEGNTQTICSVEQRVERGYEKSAVSEDLGTLGTGIMSLFRSTENREGLAGGKLVWWNVYIPSLLLILACLGFRWAPITSLLALALLARTVAVALAAPAGFTVYYLPLFIGTPFVFIFYFCEMNFLRKMRLNGIVLR